MWMPPISRALNQRHPGPGGGPPLAGQRSWCSNHAANTSEKLADTGWISVEPSLKAGGDASHHGAALYGKTIESFKSELSLGRGHILQTV